MSVNMRLSSITLETDAQPYHFDLNSSCTVLEGPVGTGKSSLLELIKYGLGGNAVLTPVIRAEVRRVQLTLRLGTNDITLERKVGAGAEVVQVLDPHDGSYVTSYSLRPRLNQETLSDELLSLAALPSVRIPRSRTRSSSVSVPLSFSDIFSYVYVEQQGIDRSVVHHTEPFREPKRRAVFELLFGLSTVEHLRLETELGRIKDDVKAVNSRLNSIQTFLESAQIAPRIDLENDINRWKHASERASASLEGLRQDVAMQTTAHDQLRAALEEREVVVEQAHAMVHEARTEVDRREHVVAQLQVDLVREDKASSASRRLSPFEFVTCPRCLQDIDADRVDHLHCTLCLQRLPETDLPPVDDDPSIEGDDYLTEQVHLLDQTRRDLAARSAMLTQAIAAAESLRSRLSEVTADSVSPRFEEIELLSARRAEAEARTESAHQMLAFWNELEELQTSLDELEARKAVLESKLREERDRLQSRSSVLDDLSAQFDDAVRELNVPWANRARIDPQTYLPLVNDETFEGLAVAGGTKTVVAVAYHLTLLGYALAQQDVLLPSLLIIDTPRKNLGSNAQDREMGDRIYRRIRALVDLHGPRVQFLIADNDVPVDKGWFRPIHFDYENPLLRHVVHPGEEAVLAGQLELIGDSGRHDSPDGR